MSPFFRNYLKYMGRVLIVGLVFGTLMYFGSYRDWKPAIAAGLIPIAVAFIFTFPALKLELKEWWQAKKIK